MQAVTLYAPPIIAVIIATTSVVMIGLGLRSGRADGPWQSADRASQPNLFWINIAALAGVAATAFGYSIFAITGHDVSHAPFWPRHPLALAASIAPTANPTAVGCQTPGPRVCLVAVGAGPDVPISDLARYIAAASERPVGVLKPIALTRRAGDLPVVDERRRQVGADGIENLVQSTYPTVWGDRDVTILALTGNDLWTEEVPKWRYAFGAVRKWPAGGGFAVVSSARMDPAAYGRNDDSRLLAHRVCVMVGRYLAILIYGAAPTMDRSSPVYGAIMSPRDLDRMTIFWPGKPTQQTCGQAVVG